MNDSHLSQHTVGTALLNVSEGGGEEQLNVTLYFCRKWKALAVLLLLYPNNQKD